MQRKLLVTALLAGGLTLTGTSAFAQEAFTTLSKVSAAPMTADQMKQVEGKAHIYLLVESRGVSLPDRAETATRAAAPTPNGGDFARSPSREATAFDFLN